MILTYLNKFDKRQCMRACYMSVPLSGDDCQDIIAYNITGMLHEVDLHLHFDKIVKCDHVHLLIKFWPDMLVSEQHYALELAVRHICMQCFQYIIQFVDPAKCMAEITKCEQLDMIHAHWPNAHQQNALGRMPLSSTAAIDGNIPVLKWLHDHYVVFPKEIFRFQITNVYKHLLEWGYIPDREHIMLVVARDNPDIFALLLNAGVITIKCDDILHSAAHLGSKHIIELFTKSMPGYPASTLILTCGDLAMVRELACIDVLPENAFELACNGHYSTYRMDTLDYLQSRGHQPTAQAMFDAIVQNRYGTVQYLRRHRCPLPDIDVALEKHRELHGWASMLRMQITLHA